MSSFAGPFPQYVDRREITPTSYTYQMVFVSPNWIARNSSLGIVAEGQDAVGVINTVLGLMNKDDTLAVWGDFSSSGTISFTKRVGYYHYGTHTQTGNAVAVLVNDPDGMLALTKRTGYVQIGHLIGPVGITGASLVGFTSSVGIRLQNASAWTIVVVGMIAGFQYGWLVDQTVLDAPSGFNIVNDNWFRSASVQNNGNAVRFLGPPSGPAPNTQCQGNHWFPGIVYPSNVGTAGVVKDAGLIHQYQFWHDVDFVPKAAVLDFQSGAGVQGGGRALSGDFCQFLFAVNVSPQIDDILVISNSPGEGGAGTTPQYIGKIVASAFKFPGGRLRAVTTAQTVATLALPLNNAGIAGDTVVKVGGDIDITAFTSGSITLQVSYTDWAGVVQTKNIGVANALGDFQFQELTLLVKAATTVTISTVGPFVATYHAAATIIQVG